jgi:DNA-binding MarR family transcriptional regulator
MSSQLQPHLLRVATECTASSLRRAARALSSLYDAHLAETGLRGTQLSLLVAVALMGEPTVNQLAARLELDRTTMTRNLGPLVRDGLLEDAAAGDRRVHSVKLTARGRRTLERALPLWDAAQAKAARVLGERRRRALHAELDALAKLAEPAKPAKK